MTDQRYLSSAIARRRTDRGAIELLIIVIVFPFPGRRGRDKALVPRTPASLPGPSRQPGRPPVVCQVIRHYSIMILLLRKASPSLLS
jgi:hypothetical protein